MMMTSWRGFASCMALRGLKWSPVNFLNIGAAIGTFDFFSGETAHLPVICDAMALMMHQWNVLQAWRHVKSWWRHQIETISPLLTICAGNSPVTGEFSAQRPVTRSFDAFFDSYGANFSKIPNKAVLSEKSIVKYPWKALFVPCVPMALS